MAQDQSLQLTLSEMSKLQDSQTTLENGGFSSAVDLTALRLLEEKAKACRLCVLCETRQNVVFADGNPQAKLMIIGEGPGANEDMTGLPFVGRAGKLLDKILESVAIDRKNDTYIANIVKCRPPQNRVPTKQEAETCRAYLESQISLIKPRIILLAGSTAVQYVLQLKDPISKIRGQWFEYRNAKAMPIFHPSYLLRNDTKAVGSPKWLMWQDIKLVKQTLDSL